MAAAPESQPRPDPSYPEPLRLSANRCAFSNPSTAHLLRTFGLVGATSVLMIGIVVALGSDQTPAPGDAAGTPSSVRRPTLAAASTAPAAAPLPTPQNAAKDASRAIAPGTPTAAPAASAPTRESVANLGAGAALRGNSSAPADAALPAPAGGAVRVGRSADEAFAAASDAPRRYALAAISSAARSQAARSAETPDQQASPTLALAPSARGRTDADLEPAPARPIPRPAELAAKPAAADRDDAARSEAKAREPEGRGNARGAYERGRMLMRKGDIAAARLEFQRGAEAGDRQAALSMAESYDPDQVRRQTRLDVKPDATEAKKWYERAKDLGSLKAKSRLAAMNRTAAR